MTIQYIENKDFDSVEQQFCTSKHVIKSDLSHTLLAPFQLAVDIAAALSNDLLSAVFDAISQPIVPKHTGCEYEYWIDYDSIGNVSLIKAKQLFDLLHEAMSETAELALIIKLSNTARSDDNLGFIQYLNMFLPKVSVYIIGDRVINKDNSTYALSTPTKYADHFLTTTPPSRACAHLFFEHTVCPDQHIKEIMQYAWTLTHIDAIQLAKNIFHACYELAQNEDNKLQYLLCLQVVRVGLQQYDDVMAQPYPSNVSNKDLIDALRYSKAYAGVLSRQFDTAGDYFESLDISEMMSVTSIMHLYQLNIYALYLFHKQRKDAALKLEEHIKQELKKFNSENTIFIKYINSLNLSRVYRAHQDYATSKDYCDLAYGAIEGLKTESDLVYYHLNYGMLYESLGEPKKAFYAWLRSALYWQTMSCPASLAWRPLASLLGRAFRFGEPVNVDQINGIFLDKLLALAEASDITINADTALRTSIRALKHANKDDLYVGVDGLSCVVSNSSDPTQLFPHQSGKLTNWLAHALQQLCSAPLSPNVTIFIDHDRGFGMKLTEADIRARCLALGIDRFCFNGAVVVADASVDQVKLILSPAVYKIVDQSDNAVIQFKRYHADIKVDSEEHLLVRNLAASGSDILANLTKTFNMRTIHNLYRHNIVSFT